jgi:hypothetical protein
MYAEETKKKNEEKKNSFTTLFVNYIGVNINERTFCGILK